MVIILCHVLRPQLKLILWKSRFELFVNITSIRLGKHVDEFGSYIFFLFWNVKKRKSRSHGKIIMI